jgi:FAD/FMN-containing dehydrogenase
VRCGLPAYSEVVEAHAELTNGELQLLPQQTSTKAMRLDTVISQQERSSAMTNTRVASHAPSLSADLVSDFGARLRGPLLRPGDAGYDAARSVWNAMIDRRPALIVQPRGAADVIAAVTFARENGFELSIKGGGHNVAGKAVVDNGLMLDMSLMKSIRVDPEQRVVRAEPGVLLGELDAETHAFGMATPAGTISTTGIAGLTLGGGQSWLASKYGFTVDNLLAVDIVTADGTLRHASETDNPDLFWAIRGAGANFGVVTSFEYRLHPVHTVLGGMVLHPFAHAREVLQFYGQYTSNLPDELTTFCGLLTAPDGNLLIALIICYVGELEEGERVVAPLRLFGSPVADTIGPVPFTAQQQLFDAAFPHGRRNYWKTNLTSTLGDGLIEAIVEHMPRAPSPGNAVLIVEFHGAYRRVANDTMAYPHRDLQYDVMVLGNWIDPVDDERNIAWVRALQMALAPDVSERAYVNDLGEEGEHRARLAYGENYERLRALKRQYDPTNVFRHNQNIQPTS